MPGSIQTAFCNRMKLGLASLVARVKGFTSWQAKLQVSVKKINKKVCGQMTVSNDDDDDDDGKTNVVLPAAVKQSGRKWELRPAMVHVNPSSSIWPHTQVEEKRLETLVRF